MLSRILVADQIKQPHTGHVASPGGLENSILAPVPQSGQVFGNPSGVREEMLKVRRLFG